MKIKPVFLAVMAALAVLLIAAIIMFYIRSPVLIVTEESFLQLYSAQRVAKEASKTAITLFRQVKTVSVANEAGYDIVPVAIMDVSSHPYCVIFPLRFANSAKLFNEQNPEIIVIILEGRYLDNEKPVENAIGSNISDLYIYKTDINDDFYNAGIASIALDQGKNGKVIVFTDKNMPQARESFLRGLHDRGNLLETRFFTSFSQYSDIPGLSCIVMAGSGSEILERRMNVPVILFTWIEPSLLPMDVVLVVDDSPWAQANQAVKMAAAGEKNGLIKSKFRFLDMKKINRRLLR